MESTSPRLWGGPLSTKGGTAVTAVGHAHLLFGDWLAQQQGRDDPVGDFADNAALDDWRSCSGELRSLHKYLDQMNANEGAHETLDRAWAEWTTTEKGEA
jgi:hypothetical protein